MSYRVTDWTRDAVVRSTLRLTPRAVAFVLAGYADNDGLCWPSVATIARLLGLHETNVRKALRELESAGLVATTPRPGHSHVYRFAVPAMIPGGLEIVHTPSDRARGQVVPTPSGTASTPSGRARPPRAVPLGEEERKKKKKNAPAASIEQLALPDELIPHDRRAVGRAIVAAAASPAGRRRARLG